jgi:hypothetical protein
MTKYHVSEGTKIVSVTLECTDCGFTGSEEEVAVHDCYVQEQGGRCEDYPCCGHTDGDGCQTRPSHTSAYWSRLHSEMGDEAYDDMIERMEQHEAMGGAVY